MDRRPNPHAMSSARAAADRLQGPVAKRFSLQAQIGEFEYELSMRARVYPRLIASRRLGQSEADYHNDRLKAALATLRWLAENEAAIRQALDLIRNTSTGGGSDGGSAG